MNTTTQQQQQPPGDLEPVEVTPDDPLPEMGKVSETTGGLGGIKSDGGFGATWT